MKRFEKCTINNWPTYFEVGKLYRTKIATWVKSTSYAAVLGVVITDEIELLKNTVFMTLDRIQIPDWHSYELKILVGEKVYYMWFAYEKSPEWYVEKM